MINLSLPSAPNTGQLKAKSGSGAKTERISSAATASTGSPPAGVIAKRCAPPGKQWIDANEWEIARAQLINKLTDMHN